MVLLSTGSRPPVASPCLTHGSGKPREEVTCELPSSINMLLDSTILHGTWGLLLWTLKTTTPKRQAPNQGMRGKKEEQNDHLKISLDDPCPVDGINEELASNAHLLSRPTGSRTKLIDGAKLFNCGWS